MYIHVTKDVPYLQLMLGLEGVIIRRIKQTYPLSVLSIKTNIQNKKDNIQNKKKVGYITRLLLDIQPDLCTCQRKTNKQFKRDLYAHHQRYVRT